MAFALTLSWLRVSRLPTVAVLAAGCAGWAWAFADRTVGVPGVARPLTVEATIPCLMALAATISLVDEWAPLLLCAARPWWLLTILRLGGTLVAATLPWLLGSHDPTNARVLGLAAIAVSVAALAVGIAGRFGWIPLLLAGYAFLVVTAGHPEWLIEVPPLLVGASVLAGGAASVGAAGLRRRLALSGR